MKILRSIHTLNPATGGPIESVTRSTLVLTRLGHEVEIISLDGPNDPWVCETPLKVHALGPGRGSYGYAPRFLPWIRQHRLDFDVVLVHGLWQYTGFAVWRALHGTDTPYFVFPHGMLDPWFRRTYPLKHVKKLLYWPWAEYRVLRDAAAVLFTSEEERRLARESFSLYHCREKVVNYGTTPPAVDLQVAAEDFFNHLPALRGKRLLLFLGRLHEKKGCDLVIQAFLDLRRAGRLDSTWRLVMGGPASDDAYLRQLQQQAGLAQDDDRSETPVAFTGMLGGSLKWGAFAAAEVFILPSHQENFGIAVAEALACGTPVLISNKVNIWREIVEDGAGFADDDDLPGTARLLERWLALPPAERERMKESARKCFARRFHIDRAVESLLEVLADSRQVR